MCPVPVSANGQVNPSPMAWPFAARFTTSALASWPEILAFTFTTPPQIAEMLPETALSVRLEISHWRLVQAVRFGSPGIAPDAHVPAAPLAEEAEDEDEGVE